MSGLPKNVWQNHKAQGNKVLQGETVKYDGHESSEKNMFKVIILDMPGINRFSKLSRLKHSGLLQLI